MLNPGTQFVKVNPISFAEGVDNGIVEYSVMAFTNGPPTIDRNNGGTGYTNGVDIHAENNVFINVDRAIAYGLINRTHDHQGGVIRNNMIVQAPGLFSAERRTKTDASIIVWDSPNTQVLHNTILNNGNSPNAIDLRWVIDAGEVFNNLTDAPIRHRDQNFFSSRDNITNAEADWFVDPPSGNLRLGLGITAPLGKARRHELAQYDIDGVLRSAGVNIDVGANEQSGSGSINANGFATAGGGTISIPNLAWLFFGAVILVYQRWATPF